RARALLAGALTGLTLPAAALALPIRDLQRRLDYRVQGGAPLLGVNGVAIVAHGKSDALAVENAIAQARFAVQQRLVATLSGSLETVEFVTAA
ncbi:MAG TPA: hypothetical protein VGE07_26095, partial [Herpetosiphonaceae bacterium]